LQELKRRGFKIGIVTDAGVSKDLPS
jgi:hypothetical protein